MGRITDMNIRERATVELTIAVHEWLAKYVDKHDVRHQTEGICAANMIAAHLASTLSLVDKSPDIQASEDEC